MEKMTSAMNAIFKLLLPHYYSGHSMAQRIGICRKKRPEKVTDGPLHLKHICDQMANSCRILSQANTICIDIVIKRIQQHRPIFPLLSYSISVMTELVYILWECVRERRVRLNRMTKGEIPRQCCSSWVWIWCFFYLSSSPSAASIWFAIARYWIDSECSR